MNPDEIDFLRHIEKERFQNVALNLLKSLDDRSLGHLKQNVKSKEDRELYAEEELIRKEKYDELRCEMPGVPRSTFLMVFSPDGTKAASTHGNHNIYVTDLRSGKNVKTLIGHPRTPWCIAFHPTSNQIVASGCLGGQVRIWDLSGGSEVWTASNQSVIASIAFHPNDRILVIATINEVYFWDWSKPEPFCHTATGNQKEKVRYVAFDKLGHKLITGISNSQNRWDFVRTSVPVSRQSERSVSPYRRRITHRIFNFPSRQNVLQTPPTNNTAREPLSSVPERERNITMCYRNLVREYGRLVQRYLQLYRPPAMIDRGTDPMEQSNTSRSSSSTQAPEPSARNQPGPSKSSIDSQPSTSNQEQSSTSNHNPYQLLTPSRILAVMNRPTTLIRGTQTTECRKHKPDTSDKQIEENGGKKPKIMSPTSESVANEMKADNSSIIDTIESLRNERNISPQPGPSRSLDDPIDISNQEKILEDLIRDSEYKDNFEQLNPKKLKLSCDIECNEEKSSASVDQGIVTKEAQQEVPPPQQKSGSNQSSNSSHHNLNTENTESCTVSMTTREASQNALMRYLDERVTKIAKLKRKSTSKSKSESSSTSEKSDNEQNTTNQGSSSKDNQSEKVGDKKEENNTHQASSQTKNEENPQDTTEGTAVDYSMPGTSRGDTGRESGPGEAQRLEQMMMNIRRNAEEKLRSRFLPLIHSVPENDRLELIRLFEEGVKESREKARLRYRNMGQMFNKKPNRRPILDTSSDTTSSEDEQSPLHMNFFNQSTQTGRRENSENNIASDNAGTQRMAETNEPNNTRDAYHDINNLENWVTSLFDDIGPQSNNTSSYVSTTVTSTQTTTTCTSTTIDNLFDRLPRSNRVQRIYAKVLRDGVPLRETETSATTISTQSVPITTRTSTTIAGSTNTRTTNSSAYSFSRRRLSSHRTSAFLPTRLYYPRTPPEFRRSRQFSFGRWRLNQRPHRAFNTSDRPLASRVANSNSNFASDEVINFSELPNSEDDPVPSFDRRPSTPAPNYPYHFHPFNPPPDLPTINPENIGIGNMYSNIVQDLENSLNDVRNIRAANRPGEMSDMLSNFSERLENIMNQSETILRNLRTSVEMLPGTDPNESEQTSSAPTASFNDANFYVRDQRTEANNLDRTIDNILGEHPPNVLTSDHTYPRNSESSVSPSSSSDTMSPLMTSLHLTISHIQRQARLLRQQVESIERIDRAMVEVAQLQLIRLLLVELSRYVRNMSGENRSTCMSSVRQMMAGTRISDSSPGESQSNDNDNTETPSSQPQPSTSNTSSDTSGMPSSRVRGITHKTYPPSRLSRLQRHHYRRTALIHHLPRRYALRLPPRNAPSPSVSFNLDPQSMMHMYSRINTFTLNRMGRRLDDLISEQVRIFTQRSFFRVPPRMPRGNIGEQNLAMRLRDSITRTNRLVGSLFDANVVRNYRMDTTAISRDGVDRFYSRQTLSFIIDGISSHLDETRGSPLPHTIRLQLQGVMTMSMLLSELLLLHIVDSIPPPTDMNLDQERQSLTSRIDQMCSTMMLSSRYGGYSTNLTHSLRQLQSMIRQNSNQQPDNSSSRNQRRSFNFRSIRTQDARRALNRVNSFVRVRGVVPLPNRAREQLHLNRETENDISSEQPMDRGTSSENRINSFMRMRSALHYLCRRNYQARGTLPRGNDPPASSEEPASVSEGYSHVGLPETYQDMRNVNRETGRHSSSNRDEQSEQQETQNSESDDNERRMRGGERENMQIPVPASESSYWNDSTWSHNLPPNRSNEENRQGEWDWNWNNNDNPTERIIRITPTYIPPRVNPNSTASPTSNNSDDWPRVSRWPWNVPSVQVNDVPVSELGPSQESSESDNPPSLGNNNNTYQNRGVMARLAAIRAVNHPLGVLRPRFLHPLYSSLNPFDADLDDPQREHIYDSDVITTVTPNHRIQVWDISDSMIPVISNPLKNVVVGECKIHNDASVDIASDGSILVTLLPSGGYLNVTNRLGVYSLKWETLGQCLYTTNFDHNAVSVSLSPLGRHLVVGLASRRASIVPSERWMMARIFRIEQKDMPGDRLPIVRELDQSRDGRATSHKSVNCIRWLPVSGQGLIYATNTGQLVIWT